MAFPNPAARNQYLKTQVETASKEQLVVMLFDGIVRFTEQARKAIEEKQIEASHNALMRAQAIVMELIVTVDKDKGGDVAQNLMALHAYSFNCLVQCNLHKDVSKIDEVQNIYRNLREGWVGAMENLGIAPTAAKTMAPATATPAAAPAAARQPGVPPVGGKPLPTSAPKAPAAPAAPMPQQKPGAGGGILASAKPGIPAPSATPVSAQPQAAPAQAAPVAPRPVAPAPKPVAATGYGMSRTAAMMGAYTAKPGIPAAAPAPAQTPAAPAPQAQQPAVRPPVNANQAAMLGAYQTGNRSIA